MKHIKKKYLFQLELTDEIEKVLETKGEIINGTSKELLKKAKESDLYVKTEQGFLIKSFPFSYSGKNALIPIPDLSLVYFDSAYNLNVLRKEKEKELFSKIIANEEKLGEDATNEIYRYYGFASSCVISLFTAIESFINHIIPNDKPYIKPLRHKTEIYTKEQVQKSISFDEKTKLVLPYFFEGKNYFKQPSASNQHIVNLKSLRDEIVHPKSEVTFQKQEELIKRLLNFKYDKTFESVASFMNFYEKDYITECDCGVDF